MKREKLTHARSLLTACVCTAASKRTTVVKPAIFFSAGSFMGFNASAKSFVRKLVQSIIFLSSNKRTLTMWQLRIFTNMQKTKSKGSPSKILHLIPHTSRWPLFPRLQKPGDLNHFARLLHIPLNVAPTDFARRTSLWQQRRHGALIARPLPSRSLVNFLGRAYGERRDYRGRLIMKRFKRERQRAQTNLGNLRCAFARAFWLSLAREFLMWFRNFAAAPTELVSIVSLSR